MRYLGNIGFVLESENVNLRLIYEGYAEPIWKTLEAELVDETFTADLLMKLVQLVREDFAGLNAARVTCLA